MTVSPTQLHFSTRPSLLVSIIVAALTLGSGEGAEAPAHVRLPRLADCLWPLHPGQVGREVHDCLVRVEVRAQRLRPAEGCRAADALCRRLGACCANANRSSSPTKSREADAAAFLISDSADALSFP